MRRLVDHYKAHMNEGYMKQIISASILLLVSLVINYFATSYADKSASNSVTDIILSNIRVYNVDNLFIYGAMTIWVFLTVVLLTDLKKIPFSLKTLALFVIIRSLFISLTHIAPFPNQIITVGINRIFDLFSSTSDLFFSGHTGVPFLFALIFWENKILRYIMIVLSVFFGIIVLMGHLHYTIDVVAAFFITYTIYSLAEKLFKKDRYYYYNGPKGRLFS